MKWFFWVLVGFVLVSCGSTREVTEVQLASLEKAVTTPQFHIQAEWALPLDNDATQVLNLLQPAGNIVNANRVFIDNGSHYIKVFTDSIAIHLPYYGTRQISGGLPGNTNIEVAQKLSQWTEESSKKSHIRNLQFEAKQKGEAYDIRIRLHAKGSATVVVNSSQRQSIRYTGKWE